jgi:MFS family permease
MAAERSGTPLIDLAAVCISPILIMTMVGSLVFFLVHVIYGGDYIGRVLYTMFFFVIGAVLIARISIRFGRNRAMLYTVALGAAVFLAMQAYVVYPSGLLKTIGPVANLGLMVLIWWSANKLTWDCTQLDEEREAAGRGLLAATGLQADDSAAKPVPAEPEPVKQEKKKRKKPAAGFLGWVDKYNAYREEEEKKPHTPGTWVIYFGLAAVPLFILGQSLIPVDDSSRRRSTFLLMAAFVGSGLGLLVTTSLLGLRKYLQDRGAKIPPAMTAGWLGMGGALIVGFLVLGAVLPRPHSETPLVSIGKIGKQDRKASKNAIKKDDAAGKGEGAAGEKKEAGDGKANAKGGKEGGSAGEKGSGGGKGKDQGGKQSDKQGQGGKQGDKQGKDGNDDQKKDGPNAKQDKNADQKGGEDKNDAGDKAEGDGNDGNDGSDSSTQTKFGEALEKVASGVKWIVWIVVAIAVVVGIFLFVLKFLAPFTSWARDLLDWFKNLFGRKKERERAVGDVEVEDGEAGPYVPPFDSFSNPFQDGTATGRPAEELVGYTFAAMESWAADRDAGRQSGETAREFVDRLLEEYPRLESAGAVAGLVARVAYSQVPLPANSKDVLATAWEEMETA